MLHAMIDCAVPAFLWNVYAIMLTNIAMVITLDDRFKILGVFNSAGSKKPFTKSQKSVTYSLACIIRSILYTEYYRRDLSPNTNVILKKLQQELSTLKAKNAYFKSWLNNSLSNSDIPFQKFKVPTDFSYMRTLEQRVLDLLRDNDSDKIPSSHINYDDRLCVSIFQKWAEIPQLIELI